MAHDCAVLGITVDALELYRCADVNALLYLDMVVEARKASEQARDAREAAEARKIELAAKRA